jgi:hypothetical protein
MNWLSDIVTLAVKIAGKLVPSAMKLEIAGRTVTALQLETATGSLAGFFSAMSAAIKTNSFEAESEVAVEEAVAIAADLGWGEPITSVVAALLPSLFGELNRIGSEALIPVAGGVGGFVTKQWAEDPRHQLNPDETFKY